MASDNLGTLPLEDDLFHGCNIAVHDIVIYNNIFFRRDLGILNKPGPNRLCGNNFTFIASHDTLGNNNVTAGFNLTAPNRTVNFDVSVGLNGKSVFNIATTDNGSHESNVSGLNVNTLNFVNFFNGDFIPDKGNMSAFFSNDGSSVFIKLCIRTNWKRNILSVFGLKIASHDGFSTLSTLRKNLYGKRLACNNILNKVKFLEINLSVCSFLEFEL